MIAFPAEGNDLDQQNRKKTFPESAVRVIAWDGPVRATAKAITAGLILVFNKTVKNRFIRLLFQQPAA